MKHRVTALATIALLAACGEVPAPTQPSEVSVLSDTPANAAGTTTVAFTTVGAATFTVPAGVTSLSVTAVGGGGGGSINGLGGSGAKVTGTVAVTPGQVLNLFVGGSTTGSNWNVGGGGSTNVLSGGVPLLIAGGGGGGGNGAFGGAAGGPGGAGAKGGGSFGGPGGNGGIGGCCLGPSGPYGHIPGKGGDGNGGNGGNSGNAGGAGGGGAGKGGDAGYYGGGGGGGYGGGSGGGAFSGGGAGGSMGPSGATFAPAGNGGPYGGPGKSGSIVISYDASIPTTTTVTFGPGPFVYNGSAFTATATVSPAGAGSATIAYSGDCINPGNTCTATATFAGNAPYEPSSASASIVITLPVATSADQCKNGGWQFVTDDLGNLFKNQGDCVSYVATKGKNKGAGGD